MSAEKSVVKRIISAETYFERLQLPLESVSREKVKKHFKGLAVQVHPDKCNEEDAKLAFQLIAEAFEVLSDAKQQRIELQKATSGEGTKRKKPASTKVEREHVSTWWEASWVDFQKSFAEREQLEEKLRKEFISSQSDRFLARRLQNDIKQAERTIRNLDEVQHLAPHHLWPEESIPQTLDEIQEEVPLAKVASSTESLNKKRKRMTEVLPKNDAQTSVNMEQRLFDLLFYLRRRHYYCLYCGCHFRDYDDLESNCPGMLESDH